MPALFRRQVRLCLGPRQRLGHSTIITEAKVKVLGGPTAFERCQSHLPFLEGHKRMGLLRKARTGMPPAGALTRVVGLPLRQSLPAFKLVVVWLVGAVLVALVLQSMTVPGWIRAASLFHFLFSDTTAALLASVSHQ